MFVFDTILNLPAFLIAVCDKYLLIAPHILPSAALPHSGAAEDQLAEDEVCRDFATAIGMLYDQHEDILIQFGDTYEQLAEGNNNALASASAGFCRW